MFIAKVHVTPQGFVVPPEPGARPRAHGTTKFAELAPMLQAKIQVAPGTTLRDLLKSLDLGIETVLLEVVLGQKIRPFLKGASVAAEQSSGRADEVLSASKSTKKGKSSQRSVGGRLHAIRVSNEGLNITEPNKKPQYEIRRRLDGVLESGALVSIDSRPLAELMDLELVYSAHTSFWADETAQRLDEAPVWEAEWSLSLVEFLQAIFWELSFQGTPRELEVARVALAGEAENPEEARNRAGLAAHGQSPKPFSSSQEGSGDPYQVAKRPRGRPKGSLSKKTVEATDVAKRPRGRPRGSQSKPLADEEQALKRPRGRPKGSVSKAKLRA